MSSKVINSVFWNSGSQLYMALVAVMVIPVFTNHFGAAVYGLIAFSLLIQSLMNMLDLGFSALLSRETSRFRVGISDPIFYKTLLHKLSRIFWLIGVVVFVVFFLGDVFFSQTWLNSKALDSIIVVQSIQILAAILAIRWICIYYRSLLFGFDELRWLAIFNITVTTLKFLLVIPLLGFLHMSIVDYFIYQLCIQIFEFFVLAFKSSRLLSNTKNISVRGLSKDEFSQTASFCFSVGASTLLWIATTQVDKVIVSVMSELADFSYFYIAVTISGVITVLTMPLVNAAVPKVTMLYAKGGYQAICDIFRIVLTAVTLLVVPTCAVMFLYGSEILSLWLNDLSLVKQVKPILIWYMLGNSLLAIGSVSYLLNFAAGELKLRNLSSVFLLTFVLISAPIGIYFFGAEGCSWAWFFSVLIYFFVWQPILIGKYSKTVFNSYLFMDLMPSVFAVILLSAIYRYFDFNFDTNIESIIYILAVWCSLALLTALSSRTFRKIVENWIKLRYV